MRRDEGKVILKYMQLEASVWKILHKIRIVKLQAEKLLLIKA